MEPLTTAGGDERSSWITLATLAAPGDPLTGKVLTGVGAVETLRLLADDGPVPGLDGISAGLWRGRLRPQAELDRVDSVMERTEQAGLRALIPDDKDYPRGLNDLGYQAPYVLWAAGNTELLGPVGAFAITGTRHATAYGRQMASELAVDLVHDWGVVVAGGASGIDAAVHETALRKGGRTIAVVATGLDALCWASGGERLEEIAAKGLLLSETPPGFGSPLERVLARLRIEAAISGSVTLVEARDRSVSRAVVDRPHELGRPVGAVPGPVTSPVSEAPNELIRDGGAAAILSATDVMNIHYLY
ncbi:DNA-processing protein DprA [uncultured Corynebacterium sp.]|uniref:DNA-processing protein DprA n=1 Tax=uncultured Corynebacterium sp. TaxID=159447 RepID=UPI00261D742A|nr:DNA-processing protein DprA [uncultured Corynebacterium sp.]